MSAETLAELSALDLTTVELRGRLPLGVLALERDGLPVDARLVEALERDEVDVTTGPGDGYGAMTSHPQRSVVPEETFARVQDWLSARPPGPAARSPEPAAGDPSVERSAADGPSVERPAAGGPSVERSAAGGPSVERPAASGPSVELAGSRGPSVERPAAGGPSVERPAAGGPSVERPAAGGPSVDGPAVSSDAGATPAAHAHAEFVLAGRAVRETPLSLARPDGGTVSGVLTTSDADGPLCAVFLNAGGVRRIGPNRMWVEAARRWAAHGVPSLRLDAIGIGESDGAPTPYAEDGRLYRPEFVPDVIDALDELQRQGIAQRFLLIGLCAGAYWSLYAGIEDPRVVGMVLLNPVVIVWDSGLGAARDVRRVFAERSWRLLRKNATPERLRAVVALVASAPRRLFERLRTATAGSPTARDQFDTTLERLLASGKHVTMAFSVREPLPGELARSGWLDRLHDAPQIDVRRVPVNDHTFRPTVMQAQVHAALDDALAASQQALVDGAPVLTAQR